MRNKRPAGEAAASPGIWQEPPELRRHVPRPVQLSGGGRAVAVVMVLLIAGAVGAGTALYAVGERNRLRRARLAVEGVSGEARVVHTGRREKGGRAVLYRYYAAGREYRRWATLRRQDRADLEAGSPVTVRYLPGEPEQAWLQGYEPDGPPLWSAIAAPAGIGIFALVLAMALRKQKRILSMGRAVEAKVVGSRKVRSQHSATYRVEYEFRTLSGSVRRATVSTKKQPRTGAVGTLLHDPDDPSKAAVYPLPLVRVGYY